MQKTPLYDEHIRLGAKVVDFNGWALPVQFAGIVQEHEQTRTACAIFDCSHMGEYRVRGKAAIAAYDKQIVSDVASIPLGRGRYGAILNDTGGLLDDLITFRLAEDELYVVTNAGPLAHVTERLESIDGVEHVSYETAKIDVQGPNSRDAVINLGFKAAQTLKYFNGTWTTWRGEDVLLCRTGYTGELGYEIFLPNAFALDLWHVLLEMDGVEPAGLGARDTLRTEVGYALSGQDFTSDITPLEAGMEDFVVWDTEFVGKEALVRKRDAGDYRVFVGIVTDSRRAPRHDFELKADGTVVGVVTSGTFGPSVGHGVGLARVDRKYAAPGTVLTAGPKDLLVTVAEPPFYKRGTCRAKVA